MKYSDVFEACITDIEAGLWTKGDYVKKINDTPCFCFAGLIYKNSGSQLIEYQSPPGFEDVIGFQKLETLSLSVESYVCSAIRHIADDGIVEYNDRETTTKEDILVIFRGLRDKALRENI